jgi:hypothetical protein
MDEMSFGKVAELARRLKVDVVRTHGDDPEEEASDLLPFVIGSRSGRMLVLVHPVPGPDGVRRAVYITAALFRVDEVWLIADSRMAVVDEGDELPAQGDLAEEWRAGRRERIQEVMMISRLPRIGDPRITAYPYTRSGRHVSWAEARPADRVSGAITDYVRDGYRKGPELWAEVGPAIEALGGVIGVYGSERQYHIDRAVARVRVGLRLRQRGVDAGRLGAIHERRGDDPMSNPVLADRENLGP